MDILKQIFAYANYKLVKRREGFDFKKNGTIWRAVKIMYYTQTRNSFLLDRAVITSNLFSQKKLYCWSFRNISSKYFLHKIQFYCWYYDILFFLFWGVILYNKLSKLIRTSNEKLRHFSTSGTRPKKIIYINWQL